MWGVRLFMSFIHSSAFSQRMLYLLYARGIWGGGHSGCDNCCCRLLAYNLVRTAFIGICLLGIADWTVGFFVQIKEET